MLSRARQLFTVLVLQRSLLILIFSQFIQFRSGTFPPLMGKVQLNKLIFSKLRITINRLPRNYNLFSQQSLNNSDMSWKTKQRKIKRKKAKTYYFIFLSKTYLNFSYSSISSGNAESTICSETCLQSIADVIFLSSAMDLSSSTGNQPTPLTLYPVDTTYLVAIRVPSKLSKLKNAWILTITQGVRFNGILSVTEKRCAPKVLLYLARSVKL